MSEIDEVALAPFLEQVVKEIKRAHEKHGPNSMISPGLSVGTRLAILVEEVGEVARALTYDEGDGDNLHEELVQVAAMALSWLYALGGRELSVQSLEAVDRPHADSKPGRRCSAVHPVVGPCNRASGHDLAPPPVGDPWHFSLTGADETGQGGQHWRWKV